MKRQCLHMLTGFLFILLLTACIGEDYDAGPPELRLSVEEDLYALKQANVDWKTEEKEFKNKVEHFLTLGSEQKEIKLSPNQSAELILLENKEDDGEYTNETLEISLWKENEKIELTTKSSTDYSFSFPSDPGQYVLEVNFRTSNGRSQYVGNITLK
ncbi:hypothetical protein ABE65_012790 [Fictibacillus phosphorivorans]|uniref:Uncharacterized protein n=1 Tax=Fictibacillus phosphorivorans TaxID=1221500 RepID=A0A161IP46_9BACL|nr:hypothetical protein [Fictibacillus phosphorivorans]ANC77625.1 hypothetical protein ABE65_012790 [Fictibacillus phosphorivorans]